MAQLKDSIVAGSLRVTNEVIANSVNGVKVYYGTCATAASTVAKDVVCPEFTSADLVKGAVVFVTVATTNSGAVASLTLNVNGTGAKPIKCLLNGAIANLPAVGYLLANQTYMFFYDGTNWVTLVDYDSNTQTGVNQAAVITTAGEYCILHANNTGTAARNGYGVYKSAMTYNPSTKALTTGGAVNGLTLTAATTGFTIAGGTTSKTLTVGESYTLGAACAKGVTDNSSSKAVTSSDTNLITGRTLYYAGYTKNAGTITGITMNGASQGTSGVVNLGTVYNTMSPRTYADPYSTVVDTIGYEESNPNTIVFYKAPKYATGTVTAASGSWTSATPSTQTISTNNIVAVTATSLLIVSPPSNITSAQLDALTAAKIVCTAQAANSITLTCYGTKPTVNIPFLITTFG